MREFINEWILHAQVFHLLFLNLKAKPWYQILCNIVILLNMNKNLSDSI